jgi:hypothetical protein
VYRSVHVLSSLLLCPPAGMASWLRCVDHGLP